MFWEARHEGKIQIELWGHGRALPLCTRAFRVRWLASTHSNRIHTQTVTPVSRIEFAADRACNYVSDIAGQSARRVGVATRLWSRSKSSRDPAGQTEFFIPVSLLHTLNWLYSYRQLAVRIVVSAITVFWLVDNVIPSRLQIVHWPNYKLNPFANSNHDTGI